MRLTFHEPPVQKWCCILCFSVIQSCTTLNGPVDCSMSPSFTISQSMLNFMSIESVIPSNHLILCCPLLRPSIFPSVRVFSNELILYIRWPKYWSFRDNISLSNEYSGLISFRTDWFDLLEVQGTLKNLLQHHSLKASILWGSATHTRKTTALIIRAFLCKVMSLHFNTLSRFVTTFLPRSKCLWISWLQSLSTVILESTKIKSVTISIISPSICHEVMWPDDMIFIFWMLSFKPAFSLFSFTFIKRLFNSSSLSTIRVVSAVYLCTYELNVCTLNIRCMYS